MFTSSTSNTLVRDNGLNKSQSERFVFLNELFLQETASYMISNLGWQFFERFVNEHKTDVFLDSISASAKKSGFFFDDFNSLVALRPTPIGGQRLNKIFEQLHLTLYNEIAKIFGVNTASSLFYKIYNELYALYGFDAGTLLDILPKSLLASSTWVSLLSKGQLEAHLIERTRELEEFNSSLEEKIRERTEELRQSLERFKKLNEEHDTSGKLLLRRDFALTRANEKLRELDKKKSEFMSIVAHQLRTPLSGIKWTLSMLIKGELGELRNEQKVFLMKSYESNERMVNLVNDMLTADRIELGKSKFVFTVTDIMDIIDNVLFEVMPQAAKRAVKLSIASRTGAIPKVPVDQGKIRAVFQNLLDNAIKYSKSEGEVVISVGEEGGFVKVAIRDRGIGIPEDQHEGIFSKFFRARNALNVETDGSGLGLFIVKSIIEKHGGRIWFESEENKGTTFYFTLKI